MALKNSEAKNYSGYGLRSGVALALPMPCFTAFQTQAPGWTAPLATTALLFPRSILCIFASLAGRIIATTNLKRRSGFLAGACPACAGMAMMFRKPRAAPLPRQIAPGHAFQNVPVNSILAAQRRIIMLMPGASMDDRVKLSAAAQRCAMIGANRDNPNSLHPNASRVVQIAAAFLIGAFAGASASKQHDIPRQPDAGQTLSAGGIIKGLLSTDQLLAYALVSAIVRVSLFAIMPQAVFYYMYVLQNMTLMPIAMTASFGLVASITGTLFEKQIGKKRDQKAARIIADSALRRRRRIRPELYAPQGLRRPSVGPSLGFLPSFGT